MQIIKDLIKSFCPIILWVVHLPWVLASSNHQSMGQRRLGHPPFILLKLDNWAEGNASIMGPEELNQE